MRDVKEEPKSAITLAREALELAERSQGDTERAYVGYYEFTTHAIAHYATVAQAAIEMDARIKAMERVVEAAADLCQQARIEALAKDLEGAASEMEVEFLPSGPSRVHSRIRLLMRAVDALTKEGEHDTKQN